MAKAFSIRDYMDDARQQVSESDIYQKVNVFDIQPNPKNQYELSEIEKLKDSIYALGGVQQNLVLMRLAGNDAYKYLALDGHRRHRACMELVQEGHKEFELVPAVIKKSIGTDVEDALLVLMNNSQRNKTDWEKVMEHMKLKEIIPKLKKRQGIDGRTRDIEADYFGVSQTQIGIYNTIGTRLDSELMKVFRDGCIGISLAYEAAKLESDEQKCLVQVAVENSGFTEEDVKKIIGSRVIKGQQSITNILKEDVSESDTLEKEQNECNVKTVKDEIEFTEPVKHMAAEEKENAKNVSESDTFVNPHQQENEIREIQIKLRGGYTLDVVETQIAKYQGYLGYEESRDSNCIRLGSYRCLLDALELLREKIMKEGINDCENNDI